MDVRAKKHLGQHFLTNEQIASDIAHTLVGTGYDKVLEIGPGKGILTEQLLPIYGENLSVIDIDTESILYLHKYFPQLENRIIEGIPEVLDVIIHVDPPEDKFPDKRSPWQPESI